ncbi:phosphoribosyl-AMP cyclohydrolase, partial [Escherichia sp. TWPC-MK]
WTKGETSGNFLNVVSIAPDCDNDTLLVLANPIGPTCHKGTSSCFGDTAHQLIVPFSGVSEFFGAMTTIRTQH